MPWTYHQSSGQLIAPDDRQIEVGYSGHEEGKNNPSMQDHKSIGPCPRGWYTMETIADEHGTPVDYEHKKAPVIRLIPDAENEMFGRAGFLIHGDSVHDPGTASLGCLIFPRWVRIVMSQSPDNRLAVTL